MVKCGNWGVTPVLIGLQRVGLVGMRGALATVDASGLSDREAIVDLLVQTLAADNYLPERQHDALRVALWREYLRHRGRDFSQFLSEVEVTVCGEPGSDLDRFLEMTTSVLAEIELKPIITLAPTAGAGPGPQLFAGEHLIVQGMPSRRTFTTAVRKSLSDW